jgi:hypothetical protein
MWVDTSGANADVATGDEVTSERQRYSWVEVHPSDLELETEQAYLMRWRVPHIKEVIS